MKLSTFSKVNNATITKFTVWNGKVESDNSQLVDVFTVNYMEKDIENLKKQIIKRVDYEKRGAVVRFVSAYENSVHVTLEI